MQKARRRHSRNLSYFFRTARTGLGRAGIAVDGKLADCKCVPLSEDVIEGKAPEKTGRSKSFAVASLGWVFVLARVTVLLLSRATWTMPFTVS